MGPKLHQFKRDYAGHIVLYRYSRRSMPTHWSRSKICIRCGSTDCPSTKVRGGQPIATAFLSRAVKGTKLKDEAIAILQSTNGIRLLRSVVHQKHAIADTSGQGATVWDLGGRAGAESGREYVRLFKEILEVLA